MSRLVQTLGRGVVVCLPLGCPPKVSRWTTDQGLEASLADVPCLFAADDQSWKAILTNERLAASRWSSDKSSKAWLFPKCLGMVDHLHIFFNALEESTQLQAEWDELGKCFADLALFLRSRELRSRMVALCVPPSHEHWRSIDWWNISSRFEWKWQYLRQFLRSLIPLLPILQQRYDLQKIKAAGPFSALNTALLHRALIVSSTCASEDRHGPLLFSLVEQPLAEQGGRMIWLTRPVRSECLFYSCCEPRGLVDS